MLPKLCHLDNDLELEIINNHYMILQLVPLEHYPNAYSDLKTLIAKPKAQSMNL